jgi:hypothetical protein
MEPVWQFLWFSFALVFLGLAVVEPFPANRWVRWGWLGLFCFVVVFWWTAKKAMT